MTKQTSLDLKTGLQMIYEDYEHRGVPFFYYIGAGVSWPDVPLAQEVTAQCRQVKNRIKGGRGDDNYVDCLKNTWTNPENLASFIAGQVSENIGLSHQLLARALIHGVPSRLAITGNFDDQMARAITCYGAAFRRLDLQDPGVVLENDPKEPTLVHIQGSLDGYTLEGLENNAPDLAPQNRELEGPEKIIYDLLSQGVALVLGFSGRENNPFMRALQQTLKVGSKDTRLYWFLHHSESYYALPKWLRQDLSVCFIGPYGQEEMPDFCFSDKTLSPVLGIGLNNLLCRRKPGSLDADRVLQGLIDRFDIPLPNLLEDPYAYVQEKQKQLDLMTFDVPEAVAYMGQRFKRQALSNDILSDAYVMLSRYQYKACITQLLRLDMGALANKERFAMIELGLNAGDVRLKRRQGEDGLEADISELLYRLISLIEKDKTSQAQFLRMRSWFMLTKNAWASGQYDQVYVNAQKALDALGKIKSADVSTDEYHDELLYMLSLSNVQIGQVDEAIELLAQSSFLTVKGLHEKNILLVYLLTNKGNYEEAFKLLDNLRERHLNEEYLRLLCWYNTNEREELSEQISSFIPKLENQPGGQLKTAKLLYLQALLARDKKQPGVKAWNRVIQTLSLSHEDDGRRIRAHAMYEKANDLKKQGSFVEAIKVFTQMEEIWADDQAHPIILLLVRAKLQKTGIKTQLTWFDEASQDFQEFVSQYEGKPSLDIQELVIQGKYAWGLLSKQQDDETLATEIFTGVITMYKTSNNPVIRTFLVRSALELARIEYHQNNEKKALLTLHQLLEDGSGYTNLGVVRTVASAYLMVTRIHLEHHFFEEAIKEAEKAIAYLCEEKDLFVLGQLGEIYLLLIESLLGQQDFEAGVAKADEYLRLTNLPNIQALKLIRSRVLNTKASLLQKQDKKKEALESYDYYITSYADLDDRSNLINAYQNRGILQRELGQNINALRSLDQTINLINVQEGSEYHDVLAQSYLEKAFLYLEEEKYDLQLNTLNEMNDYFESEKGPGVISYRMSALYERAKNHLYRQDNEKALDDLRQVRLISMSSDEPGILEILSQSVRREISILIQDGAYQQAINITDLVLDEILVGQDPEVAKNVLAIMLQRQEALGELKTYERLIDNAQQIERIYGQDKGLEVQKEVAESLLKAMEASFQLGDYDKASQTFQKLDAYLLEKKDNIFKDILARALFLQTDVEVEIGTVHKAIYFLERVDKIYGNQRNETATSFVSQALYRQGKIYVGIGNKKQGRRKFDAVISRFSHVTEVTSLSNVYEAMLGKASLLSEKKTSMFGWFRLKKAHQAYDDIIISIGDQADQALVKLRVKALYRKGRLYELQSQPEKAAKIWVQFIKDYEQHQDPYVQSLSEKIKSEHDGVSSK